MNLPQRCLLLSIFFLPFINSAQQPQENTKADEVAVLSESKPDKDLSLELASEEIILITKSDLELRSAPGDSGTVIGKLQKGVQVQQLDIIGSHYLVCYMGKCGYVPKPSISKVHKSEVVPKKVKDSLSIKATKS